MDRITHPENIAEELATAYAGKPRTKEGALEALADAGATLPARAAVFQWAKDNGTEAAFYAWEALAKAQAEEAQRSHRADEAREILEDLRAELAEHGSASPKLAEGIEALARITAAAGGERIEPASFADYFAGRVSWDSRLDFRPKLFSGLPFPRGTVSYIGARTARGKSAILVNLAREAILQGRRAVYITLELSPAQIFDRLILSTARAAAGDGLRSAEPLRELYGVLKAYQGTGNHSQPSPFARAIVPALEEIRAKTEEDALAVLDVRGSGLAAILAAMKERAREGNLVLLDYIQRLPAKDGAAAEGYERMKAVSDEVINAAVSANVVLIAAAQFNREGATKGNESKHDDRFSDASFRESGDLEQDAHNAIGLGWTADTKGRFYEVLKARESSGTGDAYRLEWDGAFQYFANSGEKYTAPKAKGGTGGGAGQELTPEEEAANRAKGKAGNYRGPK